ncbi:hypothetical protein BDZ89DRAFT_1049361 [Hymenopellis radicata]|nr:hypothetical protein BDZ89DRAFT_1049361 [Hymenopellis radicata]
MAFNCSKVRRDRSGDGRGREEGDVEGMLRSVLLSRIDGTGPEMAANGRRSTHVSIETRFSSGRRRAGRRGGRGVEAGEDPSQVELNTLLRVKSRWRSTVQKYVETDHGTGPEMAANGRRSTHVSIETRFSSGRRRAGRRGGRGVEAGEDPSQVELNTLLRVKSRWRSTVQKYVETDHGTGPEMVRIRRPTAAVQHTSQSKRASRVGDGGRAKGGRGVEAGEDPSQVELNTLLRVKSRWRSTVQTFQDDEDDGSKSQQCSTSRQILRGDGRRREEGDVEGMLRSVLLSRIDGTGPEMVRIRRPTAAVQHTSQSKRASRVGDGGRAKGRRGVEAGEDPSQVELNTLLRGKSRWRSTVQKYVETDRDGRRREEGDVEGMLRSVLLSRIDGTGPEMVRIRRPTAAVQHTSQSKRASRVGDGGGAKGGRGVEAGEDPSQVELNTLLRVKSRWRSTVQKYVETDHGTGPEMVRIRRPTAAVQHTSQSKRASRVGDGGRAKGRRGVEAGEDPSQVELNTLLRGKSRWRSTVQKYVETDQATGEDGRRVTSRTVPAPRWLGLGGDGEGGQRPPFNTRLNRNALLEWATAGGAKGGRGVEADEDPSQVELNTLLRGKSRWRSTVQKYVETDQATGEDGRRVTSRTVPAPRWLGLGGDGEGGQRPPFNTRLNRNALLEWATAGGAKGRARRRSGEDPSQVELNTLLRASQDGVQLFKSTSRQITVPAPRWLGLGGDGEGGQRPPFNTRLNRNALLEWATAGGAKGRARRRSGRRSESSRTEHAVERQVKMAFNCSKCFRKRFKMDEMMTGPSLKSTSRQITVPAPRWLGLGGDGEGGQRPPFNTRLNRNALLEWATAGGAKGRARRRSGRRCESSRTEHGVERQVKMAFNCSKVRRDRSRPTAAVQHTSQSKRASRVGDGGGRAGRRGGRGVEADEDASQVELNTVLRGKSTWRSTVQKYVETDHGTGPEMVRIRRPTAAVQHTSQSKRASRVGDGGGRAGRRGGRGVEADEDASQVELNTVLRGKSTWRSTVQKYVETDHGTGPEMVRIRRPTAAVQHTSQSKRASRVGDGGGRAGRRGGRGVEADEDASQVELNTVLRGKSTWRSTVQKYVETDHGTGPEMVRIRRPTAAVQHTSQSKRASRVGDGGGRAGRRGGRGVEADEDASQVELNTVLRGKSTWRSTVQKYVETDHGTGPEMVRIRRPTAAVQHTSQSKRASRVGDGGGRAGRRGGRGVEADEDASQVELNTVLRGKSTWRSTVQKYVETDHGTGPEMVRIRRPTAAVQHTSQSKRASRVGDGGGRAGRRGGRGVEADEDASQVELNTVLRGKSTWRSTVQKYVETDHGTGPEMVRIRRPTAAVQHTSQSKRASRVGDGGGRAGRRGGRGVEADEDASQVELNTVLRGKSTWRSTVQKYVETDHGTGPEMAANGRRSTHVSIETRFPSGRRRRAGGAKGGRGVEADEDASQVELNTVLRGKSTWRSTVQKYVETDHGTGPEMAANGRRSTHVSIETRFRVGDGGRRGRRGVEADEDAESSRTERGVERQVFPQAFQDDGSKSQSSTSRQITVPAPRWLGLGGDGEGGQRPPFNTRLNRNALLEWATAAGRGRGVLKRHEDPSQVELNAVLRRKSRWRSTVQSESDLNQRLHSEVKVFPQAFQDDGSKSQSSTSRQITVPAPRWLGLGGDGEG